MRFFGARKTSAVIITVAVAAAALITAGASAATLMFGVVPSDLGASLPDISTGGLMLASFFLIGAGVRSRKRSVVLS